MIEAIRQIYAVSKTVGWSDNDVALRVGLLTDALLSPELMAERQLVALFAHGPEAVRVWHDMDVNRYALQLWSVHRGDWLTQRIYSAHEKAQAVTEAKEWYLPSSANAMLKKWGGVLSTRPGVFEQTIDTKAKLAEFYYDTKDVDWTGYPNGCPWTLLQETAKVELFSSANISNIEGQDAQSSEVAALRRKLREQWSFGNGGVDALIVWMQKGGAGDDVPILMEVFGCDYEQACNAVSSGRLDDAIQMLRDVVDPAKLEADVRQFFAKQETPLQKELERICRRAAINDYVHCNDHVSYEIVLVALRNSDDQMLSQLGIFPIEEHEDLFSDALAIKIEKRYQELRKLLTDTFYALYPISVSDKYMGGLQASRHAGVNDVNQYLYTPEQNVMQSRAQSVPERKPIVLPPAVEAPANFKKLMEDKVLAMVLDKWPADQNFDQVLAYFNDDGRFYAEGDTGYELNDTYQFHNGAALAEFVQDALAVEMEYLKNFNIRLNESDNGATIHGVPVNEFGVLLTDVASLCDAVSDGDPQVIAERREQVIYQLPAIGTTSAVAVVDGESLSL